MFASIDSEQPASPASCAWVRPARLRSARSSSAIRPGRLLLVSVVVVMPSVSSQPDGASLLIGLWTTDSLQRACFQPPPPVPDDAPRTPERPSRLFLPYPDAELHEAWCPVEALTPTAAAHWDSNLFSDIIRFDRATLAYYDLEARVDAMRAGDLPARGKELGHTVQTLLETGKQVGAAARELEATLEEGLEGREGTRLIGSDLTTYLQMAARLEPQRSHWRVCNRCIAVFSAKRRILRNAYRCMDCKGQRLPPLPPASRLRRCQVCECLFSPSDIRQLTCPAHQATKSTRSRNPNRPVEPGTELRRSPWMDISDSRPTR